MDRNTQQETVAFNNSSVSLPAGKQRRSSAQSAVIIAVSWLILAVTLALDVYFTSVISENNTKLTEENQKLIKKNQNLEIKRHDLNQQIQKMETEWNKFNISRAQWSIEAYCPKENGGRLCESCQRGWRKRKAGCYAVINPQNINDWRNWTEARDDCRRMISDLVVVGDDTEKQYVSRINVGTKGFWIGLRVEDGKWKWIDGSDLKNSSWIKSPEEGHCAVSYINRGWESVSCSETNRWICEKEALSV
ncbi:C-type lectin domain family 10 member A-like [Echeneis naucrates]|uniref:C-type lectin domain family 10 member A-like n=1 Tax=Echeneis naucrates TaxID=173247 RepID=A0A665T8G4_ECHNA|nr:C-type lectin domain family 10 member A-like [Echeneis naucrates]